MGEEIRIHAGNKAVTKLTATVHQNKLKQSWRFDYLGDTASLPVQDKRQRQAYTWPEYYWVAEAGKKTFGQARAASSQTSGLLRFKDRFHVHIRDEQGHVRLSAKTSA